MKIDCGLNFARGAANWQPELGYDVTTLTKYVVINCGWKSFVMRKLNIQRGLNLACSLEENGVI
jgi:hypothetical protein